MKHLKIIYFSNSWEYLLAACAVVLLLFLALLSLKRILAAQLYKRARRTATYWDDILAMTAASTSTVSLLVFSFLSGLYILDLPDEVNAVNAHLAAVVFLFQCGLWLSKAISGWLAIKASPEPANGTRHETMNMHIIGFITRIVIWTIVLLLILDNLGINITALIASLGIGGVAVALAVQNILGDLFASLSIAINKPFEVGDSIVINDLNGTVKYVGLKTTRLTSISGEELVISNADLLKSRIHNFKKMQERRMVFTIGVTFDTSSEKLRRISEIIQEDLQPHSHCPAGPGSFQQHRSIQSGFRNRLLRQGFQLYNRHGRTAGNQFIPDRTFCQRKYRIRFSDTDTLRHGKRAGISRYVIRICPLALPRAMTGYKDGADCGKSRQNQPFQRLLPDA